MAGSPGFDQPDCGHNGRAVSQCEPFFGGKYGRPQATVIKDTARSPDLAFEFGLALAYQYACEVGQRREVAAFAESPQQDVFGQRRISDETAGGVVSSSGRDVCRDIRFPC